MREKDLGGRLESERERLYHPNFHLHSVSLDCLNK